MTTTPTEGQALADASDVTTMIDAGARAWFNHSQEDRRDDGRHRPDGRLWQWEDLPPIDQRAYRALVTPVIHAALAAVHIAQNTKTHVIDGTRDCASCGQAWPCATIRTIGGEPR